MSIRLELVFAAISSYFQYTGYTVIVHKMNRLHFKHVITHLYLYNRLLSSVDQKPRYGAFIAALAFKVLQLAMNVHLTVADAMDTLISQESLAKHAMQAKYSMNTSCCTYVLGICVDLCMCVCKCACVCTIYILLLCVRVHV